MDVEPIAQMCVDFAILVYALVPGFAMAMSMVASALDDLCHDPTGAIALAGTGDNIAAAAETPVASDWAPAYQMPPPSIASVEQLGGTRVTVTNHGGVLFDVADPKIGAGVAAGTRAFAPGQRIVSLHGKDMMTKKDLIETINPIGSQVEFGLRMPQQPATIAGLSCTPAQHVNRGGTARHTGPTQGNVGTPTIDDIPAPAYQTLPRLLQPLAAAEATGLGGRFYVTTAHGAVIRVQDDTASAVYQSPGPQSIFEFEDRGDGQVALKCHTGKYFCVEDTGRAICNRINVYAPPPPPPPLPAH